MNSKEYRERLSKLAPTSFTFGFLNLASEAGEVLGVIKTAYKRNEPIDRASMIDELGDVLASIEILLASDEVNSTVEEVRAKNIIKLEYRDKHGKNKKEERKAQLAYRAA